MRVRLARASTRVADVPRLAPSAPAQPLPPSVARRMGQSFGHDFSHVRIHRDDLAVASAGAQAVTVGDRVRVAPGYWAPSTPSGLDLLGHELAHVVQQHSAAVPASTAAAEREADVLGARAARGEPAPVRHRAPAPVQARMGFEFQGANTIEWEIQRDGVTTFQPFRRKEADPYGRASGLNFRHVKLEADSRGDFEFVTAPFASRAQVLGQVREAVQVVRAVNALGASRGSRVRIAPNRALPRPWSSLGQMRAQAGRGREVVGVVIHMHDPGWHASPQATEGVPLSAIPSLVSANFGPGVDPRRQNRPGALSGRVDAMLRDARVAPRFARLPSDAQAAVRGLLTYAVMAMTYAQLYDASDPSIKASYSIMHRTSVAHMYRALRSPARSVVRRVFGGARPQRVARSAFSDAFGWDHSQPIFPNGILTENGRQSRPGDLTLGHWLQSILRSRRDLLSPPRTADGRVRAGGSMGKLPMDRGLAVFEVRNHRTQIQNLTAAGGPLHGMSHSPGGTIPFDEWVRWATFVFDRARATNTFLQP